uniref:RFX1/2/3 regulatory factor X n=1 Tax=Phallusia mammillata TaxID=59560 RepID=A0A6F9DRF2_9ASCI|nr:RFX1/2/3 regulatory factor X [Phallusia mammillata]
MQQNVSSAQQSAQVASATHSQIPVAHYVSVVAAKSDTKLEGVKSIVPVQQSTGSRKVLIRCEVRRPEEKNHKPEKLIVKEEVNQEKASFSRITTPQQRTQPIHVAGTQQSMYQTNQLQYVDSTGDHGYTNGSTSNSFQYNDTNQLFTSTQQQSNNSGIFFDSTSGNHASQNSGSTQQQLNTMSMSGLSGQQGVGQIISSPGGSTYLIQNSSSESGGIVAMPLSHSTRASPATVSHFRREPKTVHWLMEHFENAEGVSLPRALMYNHYILHCNEQTLDPVNAASFGKLVRSVFLGLRTRRLGTRGNSKYHYYGIRIKANSPLNRLQDEINCIAMRQQSSLHRSRNKMMSITPHDDKSEVQQATSQIQQSTPSEQVQQQAQQHQQYLGDATQALPDLDPIQFTAEDPPLPDDVTQDDLMILEDLYRDHCSNVLDVIVSLQFTMIENLWQSFWRADYNSDEPSMTREEFEMKLPRHKLLALCSWAPVQRWVKDSDHMMYQSLVEVLIPDVLRPIPSALTQAIRNFAKGLETNLKRSLEKGDIPMDLIRIKVSAVSAFSQTLRRYTSLNHLAQAARAVLNNVSQINQMLADLNRVDFANVQEQASWVCQCDDNLVRELETDFKSVLSEQRTLEQWADWLENVVGKILQPHEGSATFARAARQFLLKWCFYSSMVIRDLTLRSAASFGSFHLIRLLYDEYMFYLVEHRVAQATGETAIAVMGDFANISASHIGLDVSPSSVSSSDISTNPSPTFIASAPISQGSIVKTEKGVKRTADMALLDVKPDAAAQINGKVAMVSEVLIEHKTSDV